MRRRFSLAIIIVAALLYVFPAAAGDNDLQLSRLNYYDYDHCGWMTPKTEGGEFVCVLKPNGQENFESLATELGILMSPKMMATADTLGEAGFEFGLATSFTTINNTEEYWQVVNDGDPDSVMNTIQLQVRKGLPFGMEIGATLTQLAASKMMHINGMFAISLNEGVWKAPDITLRFFGGRLAGVGELNLSTAGGDAVMSKEFSLDGVGTMTPYAGYEFLYVNANTKLIDPTPSTLADGDSSLISFNRVDAFANKLVVGLRYVITAVAFYAQADITDQSMQSYTVKLAVEF